MDDRSIRFGKDEGYVLAMTALLILPLMVFVSFAIDAGAWYAQASRMQRAADAAALAAVVYLPNTGAADAARDRVAAQNGYTTGVTGSATSETTYQVTITSDATRFFSGTFDSSTMSLGRSATAEFNKPVPLGSPNPRLGNDVTSCPQKQPSPACAPQPMLWSAINGPYQAFAQGDPYSTKCPRNSSNPASTTNGSPASCDNASADNGAVNPLYKPNGYEFAIDVGGADVGKILSFEVFDAGVFSRRIGQGAVATSNGLTTGTPVTRTVSNMRSNGTSTVTRTSGNAYEAHDVGDRISGGNIPANTTIEQVISPTQVRLSNNVPSNGTTNHTYTITQINNCNRSAAPFTSPPYTTSGETPGTQNCQTGDSGNANFEAQLFQNDGVDLTVDFSNPILNCRMVVREGTGSTAIMNNWVKVCDFQANLAGVYPIRVKSSNIAGVTDSGVGNNAFAMRVQGGVGTRLYALNDLSIYTNTPSSGATFYLAEIGPEHAGKRLQIDLYDAGDGSGSSDFYMKVLAPPSGLGTVPNAAGATTIPASNIADSCRYNTGPSAVRDVNVTAPAGTADADCRIRTKDGSNNIYNASWLRIEVKIASNYNCGAPANTVPTDCWWSINYDFGSAGLPTDRTVWSIKVVGDPVHLIE